MSLIAGLAVTAAWNAVVFFGLWRLSLRLRNASIVDVYWGPGFAAIAAIAWAASPGPGRRGALLLAMTALWGLRLGAYLGWRNRGKGEDPRYAAMRRHHGERFGRVSGYSVFALQALLMWIVSLPVQAALLAPGAAALGALDVLGVGLWAAGLFFEAVGDWQLARFKAEPANRGRVMDRGLWRYTRHPNYFGDCCIWWAFFLFAAAGGGWWSFVGPLLMSFLLLRVSGVALLEKDIGQRRPGYRDYVLRTNAFFPGPPKRGAQTSEGGAA